MSDPARGLKAFQEQVERIYLDRDRARGWEKTFAWFIEELGERHGALGGRESNHSSSVTMNIAGAVLRIMPS